MRVLLYNEYNIMHFLFYEGKCAGQAGCESARFPYDNIENFR